MASEILDLDALIPQDTTVRLGGQDFPVKPPSLETVLRIMQLGDQLEEHGIKGNHSEALKSFRDLSQEITQCAPELKGHELTSGQLMALAQFIVTLGMPKNQALEEQGITPANAKKNTKQPAG